MKDYKTAINSTRTIAANLFTGWWTVLTSRPYRASKALSPEPTTTDAGDCPLCKAGHSDKCEDHAYHKE